MQGHGPGLERVLGLVGGPAGVGGVALLHQGAQPLGELGPGAGAEVDLGGQAVPAVAVVAVFGVVLGGQLLDEPAVERGVEAVLLDRSALLDGELLGPLADLVERRRRLVRVEPGLLHGVGVHVEQRRRGVERHRPELALDRVVAGDVGLDVRVLVELVGLDELVHRHDLLGVVHEARADVVDLHQRRRGLLLDGLLVRHDHLVVVALEHRLHGDLGVGLLEVLHHGLDGELVLLLHGVPELDLDRFGDRVGARCGGGLSALAGTAVAAAARQGE